MGIKDLLKFMKPYIEPIHIKKYSGKRVGIDAYSWLHKGAYSCSMELCLNSDNEKKLRYIDYFMHRINLLRHHKIIPVVVFDGCDIPCKAGTEQERHRRRNTNRDLAMAKLNEGDIGAATELFQRAVGVTPRMAYQLIKVLRSENIEFIVAPYEADAQLAYLSSLDAEKGGITAVITEDSDLIAYGCKSIIFKMDRYGKGEEILLDNVFDSVDRTPSFRGFDKELLIGMCVLAGCDFLPSVPGIGIVKSHGLVSKYRNLDRVLSVLKLEKRYQMPEDYPKSFKEAVIVFQHAQIYDASSKKLKHMRPLPETLLQSEHGELDFLGPDMPQSVAIAIAEGNLDPISMEAFDHSPSTRTRSNPVRVETSGRVPRVEAPLVIARKSCFSFSSQRARESNSVITEDHNLVPDEEKTHNKVEALQKLITTSIIHTVNETTTEITDTLLKVPNNNPFKRRKPKPTHPDEAGSRVEVPSDSEAICHESNSENVSGDGASRKRKIEETTMYQVERVCQEISWATPEEKSDVICVDFESQESVNSKANSKITGRGKRGGKAEKINSTTTKSFGAKKSSILNFFSRV